MKSRAHVGNIVRNQFPAAGYGTNTRANSEFISDPDTFKFNNLPPGHNKASSLSASLFRAKYGVSGLILWLMPMPMLLPEGPLDVGVNIGSRSRSSRGIIFLPRLKQALTV